MARAVNDGNGGWSDRYEAWAARRITSVDRAQELAHRRVVAPVEGYLEGGAGHESTLRANLAAVRSVQFVQRVGVTSGVSPDLRTTVLGTEVSMPVLLSPVGFTRMMHTSGDVAGAAAAGAAGTVFTLSSMSGHTMEEVIGAARGPVWFQLYFLGGRAGARNLVAEARRLGYSAVVVTMDTQLPGDRRRESRYALPPPLSLNRSTVTKMIPFVVRRPRWLVDQALGRFQLDLVNAVRPRPDAPAPTASEALLEWLLEPPMWSDLEWIKEEFDGHVIAKGVLNADDARRAVDHGASAVIVSNHGGRQLDGVPATFAALPEIVRAVGDDAEVLVDGGIRSGADAVRAVGLGARAAMIGRAWAYGLCAAGQPGVDRVLTLMRQDVDRTMRLLGAESVADIDASLVRPPTAWPS
ncbi:MAG TPA: alpha-hydroxy acid oxidase [Acidimicrobiales bacterium]|nr:alpha-hydroxy acid oxidase [Acidimicrobiales bacterium]